MDSQTHELHRVRNDLNKELHHWVRCKEINMEMLHWLDASVQPSFRSRTVKTLTARMSHVPESWAMLEIISVVSSWFPLLAVFLWGLCFFFWLHFYLLPFFSSLLSWFSTQPLFHLFLFFFLPVLPYFLISPLCVSFHSVIVGSSVHHTESFACVFSNLYFQLSPIPLTNWNILQPACNALTISVSPLKSLSCFTRCLSASLVAFIWIC